MIFIDTHTHLYLKEFDADRFLAVQRSINAGIPYMILPDIDSNHTDKMLDLCRMFPGNCFPMIGLHPTSVNENFNREMEHIKLRLQKEKFYAIGETGIDLYWDKSFFEVQCNSFREQLRISVEYDLPVCIHSRNSLNEIIKILSEKEFSNITGVFHCFPGSVEQARVIVKKGFKLGIGGVITYKNAVMAKVVKDIGLGSIILETDAPYLPPVPYRGQRNESAYIVNVAAFVADLIGCDISEVAEITSNNALELFKIPVS